MFSRYLELESKFLLIAYAQTSFMLVSFLMLFNAVSWYPYRHQAHAISALPDT